MAMMTLIMMIIFDDNDDLKFVVGLFVLEAEGYLTTNNCNVADKDYDDDYYYHYDDDDYDDDDAGIYSICLRTEGHLAFFLNLFTLAPCD